jgi:hypothetical protein
MEIKPKSIRLVDFQEALRASGSSKDGIVEPAGSQMTSTGQLGFAFNQRDLTTEDLSWMAGFFDGEGHIEIAKYEHSPYGRLVASVTNMSRDVLTPFLIFGGRIFIAVKKSNVWRWQAYGGEAKTLLERLLPYLRLKRDTAKVAIAFQNTMGHYGTRPITPTLMRKRDALIECFRGLQPARRGMSKGRQENRSLGTSVLDLTNSKQS